MKRKFSPYEQNQLRKYGISIEEALTHGDMPVEYINGHCEFYGRDFLINQSVLIPRIETEIIVDIALKYVSSLPLSLIPDPLSLSDVGTGSGVLGITLYKELTSRGLQTTAYLSDISSDALAVAKKNRDRLIGKMYYNRSGRTRYNTFSNSRTIDSTRSEIKFLKSDLFASYPENLKFDLVVANLPYIPSDRISKLPPSVRNFEPRLALDGGADDLKLINECIQQLPARLKPHGIAILEIDETHTLKSLRGSVSRRRRGNLTLEMKIKKDQFGKKRFLVARRSGL